MEKELTLKVKVVVSFYLEKSIFLPDFRGTLVKTNQSSMEYIFPLDIAVFDKFIAEKTKHSEITKYVEEEMWKYEEDIKSKDKNISAIRGFYYIVKFYGSAKKMVEHFNKLYKR